MNIAKHLPNRGGILTILFSLLISWMIWEVNTKPGRDEIEKMKEEIAGLRERSLGDWPTPRQDKPGYYTVDALDIKTRDGPVRKTYYYAIVTDLRDPNQRVLGIEHQDTPIYLDKVVEVSITPSKLKRVRVLTEEERKNLSLWPAK